MLTHLKQPIPLNDSDIRKISQKLRINCVFSQDFPAVTKNTPGYLKIPETLKTSQFSILSGFRSSEGSKVQGSKALNSLTSTISLPLKLLGS
jgi:hypothetical protein